MSTSGGTLLNAVLYLVAVVAGLQAGLLASGAGSGSDAWRRLPDGQRSRDLASAAATWLVVAVPSLLQFPVPAVLRDLERDPELIRRHGQGWRVVTSLTVQDGGAGGTAFNLVLLAVVLAVAVPVWGWWRAPAVLLACQLVFNTLATFLVDERGAGNSGATFGLSASLAGLAVARAVRSGTPPARPGDELLRGAGVLLRFAAVPVVGVLLLVLGDAHGIAFLGGVVIGAVLAAATEGSLAGRRVWQDGRRDAHG